MRWRTFDRLLEKVEAAEGMTVGHAGLLVEDDLDPFRASRRARPEPILPVPITATASRYVRELTRRLDDIEEAETLLIYSTVRSCRPGAVGQASTAPALATVGRGRANQSPKGFRLSIMDHASAWKSS